MSTLTVGIIVLVWVGLITAVLAFCAAAGRAESRDAFMASHGAAGPEPDASPRRSARFERAAAASHERGVPIVR